MAAPCAGRLFPIAKLVPVSATVAVGTLGQARIRVRRVDLSRKHSHILEAWAPRSRCWFPLDPAMSREYDRVSLRPYITSRMGILPLFLEATGEHELTLWVGSFPKLQWEMADRYEQLGHT